MTYLFINSQRIPSSPRFHRNLNAKRMYNLCLEEEERGRRKRVRLGTELSKMATIRPIQLYTNNDASCMSMSQLGVDKTSLLDS